MRKQHRLERIAYRHALPSVGDQHCFGGGDGLLGEALEDEPHQAFFVGKPGVERADRRAGALHHLGHGHVVEAALVEQRLGGIEQPIEGLLAARLQRAPHPLELGIFDDHGRNRIRILVLFYRSAGYLSRPRSRLGGAAADGRPDERQRLAHAVVAHAVGRKARALDGLEGAAREVAVARESFPERLDALLPAQPPGLVRCDVL
jgi:hypothetical protein